MYQVFVDNRAKKVFHKLQNPLRKKIISALEKLTKNPRTGDVKKLRGVDGYRLRVGDYRILYDINDSSKIVRVYKIGPRRDIYR